jgi:hypothetical protein
VARDTSTKWKRRIQPRGAFGPASALDPTTILRVADRGYVMETRRIALVGQGRNLLEIEHARHAYLGAERRTAFGGDCDDA